MQCSNVYLGLVMCIKRSNRIGPIKGAHFDKKMVVNKAKHYFRQVTGLHRHYLSTKEGKGVDFSFFLLQFFIVCLQFRAKDLGKQKPWHLKMF